MSAHIEMHSQEIGSLMEALSKAQSTMEGAIEDSSNPFFKSSYADLTSVWKACREPLTKNGLSITQTLQLINGERCLVSILGHSSGQWIKSVLPLKVSKDDIQALGSSITYSRRYSLAALVGICPADDDGNEATGKPKLIDEEPLELTVAIPEFIKKEQVEKFINECSRMSNQTRNQIILAANQNPEKFLEKLIKKFKK